MVSQGDQSLSAKLSFEVYAVHSLDPNAGPACMVHTIDTNDAPACMVLAVPGESNHSSLGPQLLPEVSSFLLP